jgi:serine/threonine protein kinase
VKVFSVEKMEDLQIREEDVRREASTLGMLRHKNIIRYFGLVETDDEMAIVMELALGGSVANFIAKRANALGAETRELFEILVQTADALDYIHSQGIVHRDIKPENVLLAHAEGPLCIKLADFGVAAVLNTVAGSALMSKTGTLPYFSPERGNEQACILLLI